MTDAVCRAITFINYNMPIREGEDDWKGHEKYYTTGFFDRMYTKKVDCPYKEEQLQTLWKYGISCITRGEGKYAHQSVFCFSQDSWNRDISDEDFWSSDKYEDMLLTFVVFVQTRDYIIGTDGMKHQCERFNAAARNQLGEEGHVYTYGTVDKNDFVVCIRSRSYKKAVDAIMKLHGAGCSIVYSYSVFGISEVRQQRISEEEYRVLNLQKIDSISLKGVTNSVRPDEGMAYSLDQKYFSFCRRFVEELYAGEQNPEEEPDFKIYDILGDNDFRLIARMVPLGNLIRQLGKKGLLNYYGNAAQFTFFSTHLILNTHDPDKQQRMPLLKDTEVSSANGLLQSQYKTEWCTRLKGEMDSVMEWLGERCKKRQYLEKLIPACYGIYQLLQSLTALEAAPTKKYDFYSMYYPLEALVHILKEGCCEEGSKEGSEEGSKERKDEALAENGRLYEFVHKISMTLHGTLRTDIQFFQIRDFNATLHYAPAKLRAYYTMFVYMVSAHIKEMGSEPSGARRHSYIFCPGMFKGVGVRQLFRRPADEKRLMLISVPERYLYFPKSLSIILAHEVGHLAGEKLRNRKGRHETFLNCSYRILCLELTKLIDYRFKKVDIIKPDDTVRLQFKDSHLRDALLRESAHLEEGEKDTAHMYYSEASIQRIVISYRNVCEMYGGMYCAKHAKSLLQGKFWKLRKQDAGVDDDEYGSSSRDIRSRFLFCESLADDMKRRFELYRTDMLKGLLQQFHYLLSEPVSDILAILILGLEPYEYLYSIADERKANGDEEQFSKGLTKVRTGLVVHVMERLREEYVDKKEEKEGGAGKKAAEGKAEKKYSAGKKAAGQKAVEEEAIGQKAAEEENVKEEEARKKAAKELLGSWEDVYRKVGSYLNAPEPKVRDLIVEASGYKDGLGNKLDDIDKYQSPINQEKNVVVEKKYDCLNDKEVFEMMSGYLLACGKEYVSKIFENPEREVVVREFFRKCDGDTPIGLMEQVDVFLHRFENEWKDEYF